MRRVPCDCGDCPGCDDDVFVAHDDGFTSCRCEPCQRALRRLDQEPMRVVAGGLSPWALEALGWGVSESKARSE